MKQNKNNIINQAELVEFTVYNKQLNPGGFRITGDYESIAPLHEDMQRDFSLATGKAALLPQVVVQAPAKALETAVLAEGLVADLAISWYDLCNGTSFRQAIQQQRQLRKDTAFAQKIGILGIDRCAKHERAMRRVREL